MKKFTSFLCIGMVTVNNSSLTSKEFHWADYKMEPHMVTQYHFRLISQPINPGVICTPAYYTIRSIHNTYQDALWIHDFYLEFDKN